MLVVAGISLKNLEPRVWDPSSEFYIPALKAVMVSYGEFHQMPSRRDTAMRAGLRKYLDVRAGVQVFLDNGAFYFGAKSVRAPFAEYEAFVKAARPDWKPIPQDYIPFPGMSVRQKRACFRKTMQVNCQYVSNGYVPVIHIGNHLAVYIASVKADRRLRQKKWIALGAIVPNLLRKPKAMPYSDVLSGLIQMRREFRTKSIHVFGVGGTATLHIAALLGFDSADSSGWRNRAARGIVQLPGSGERLVASLGSWRGRSPSRAEWQSLRSCGCPACSKYGVGGLKADKLLGFKCRATHNLWVLLDENAWLEEQILEGTYAMTYEARLNNSTYRPIIDGLLSMME